MTGCARAVPRTQEREATNSAGNVTCGSGVQPFCFCLRAGEVIMCLGKRGRALPSVTVTSVWSQGSVQASYVRWTGSVFFQLVQPCCCAAAVMVSFRIGEGMTGGTRVRIWRNPMEPGEVGRDQGRTHEELIRRRAAQPMSTVCKKGAGSWEALAAATRGTGTSSRRPGSSRRIATRRKPEAHLPALVSR